MTLEGTTQRVTLTIGDWTKLIGLTIGVVSLLVGTLWRQEALIRDVAANQELLEYRVTQLENRLP
jgi:hypothetical protein